MKPKHVILIFCFSPSSDFRSQDENGEPKSRFIKTKSLREKFRDSRPWNTLRKSAEKEIPAAATLQAISTPAATVSANSGPEQTATEGRLSRLFSLRRSVGPSKFYLVVTYDMVLEFTQWNASKSDRLRICYRPPTGPF